MSSANWNSYQEWVMTKAGGTDGTMVDALVLSALGITGEGGEFANTIKKIAYHDHELTSELRMKLALELGDILWYVARASEALMLPLSDIAQLNVLKLNARYKKGFTTEESKTKKTDEAVAADMSEKPDGTDLAARGTPQ